MITLTARFGVQEGVLVRIQMVWGNTSSEDIVRLNSCV